MERDGLNLDQIVQQSHELTALHRGDLHPGDTVYVRTYNSLYRIRVEEQRSVRVSGGWFDREGDTPAKTTITGCTWGGSVIKVDIVAAVGLRLEFGNRVTTSPIMQIIHIRQEQEN